MHNRFQAVALSDEEFAKFKCRGGSFYQYGNADGGHTVTEINEYASADNNYQVWMKKLYHGQFIIVFNAVMMTHKL